MALPDAPYFYDDSRLTYDEHCFFYDGGYDSICLMLPSALVIKRTGGGGRNGSSSQRRKKVANKPFLNVFIESYVKKLNGDPVDLKEVSRWTRFSGEDEPMAVFINGITLRTKTPYKEGYLKGLAGSTNEAESLNISLEFLGREDPAPEPEPEVNVDIDVKIVESYSNIQITMDLISVSSHSVKPESQVITHTEKGTDEQINSKA